MLNTLTAYTFFSCFIFSNYRVFFMFLGLVCVRTTLFSTLAVCKLTVSFVREF